MNDLKSNPSKEERIAVRRTRINLKKNQGGKNVATKDNKKEEDEKNDETKKQTKSSRDLFDQEKDEAIEEVTAVQANSDWDEINRRKKEEAARKERSEKRCEETLESAKANAEIEAKWSIIAQENVPDKLMDDLKEQFNAAGDLIVKKGEVIKELTTALQSKDDAYVKLLSRHHDDITSIVAIMNQRFNQLLTAAESELVKVEETAVQERAGMLTANYEQIDKLFNVRKTMEQEIMKEKGKTEDSFQDELAVSRARNAEEFSSLKIELQNNIQLLEQQLEEMRATYQLNSEKLKYNRDVLTERNNENIETFDCYCKRIRGLKETLANAKSDFTEKNNRFIKENTEMTDDYKKKTEQFKDLQKKYHHFEMVDTKKYREVWDMNETSTMELVTKTLQADQIIHQQVLGLQWKPPGGMGVEKGYVDIKSITPAHIFAAPLPDFEEKNRALNVGEYFKDGQGGEDGVDGEQKLRRGRFSNVQVKEVLQMIEKQGRFLIDGRVRADLESLAEDEAELGRIDAILTALGVEDKEDLDELVACFIDENDPENTEVEPNEVVHKLQGFVDMRLSKSKNHPGLIVKQSRTVQSEKKLRRQERERKFWTKLGMVIPEKTVRMWSALEVAQRDYNQVLEERSALIDETTELARQNEELKILLQEYLSSKINQELEVPPTRLIRM